MAEPSTKRIVPGTERTRASSSVLVEPLDDSELVSAALMLRLPPNGPTLPDLNYWQRTPPNKRRFLSSEEYAATYSAAQSDIDDVLAFLSHQGITVTECNAATRTVTARGTAAQMKAAFDVQLNRYRSPMVNGSGNAGSTHVHRGYDGPIRLPPKLSEIVTAVIGLDNRRRGGPATTGSGDPPGAVPVTILDMASHYNFPTTGQPVKP